MSEPTIGYELFSMPEGVLPEGQYAIRMTEGEFDDVLFTVEKIDVVEDPTSPSGSKMEFTYALIENPVFPRSSLDGEELVRFEQLVGDMVIQIATSEVPEDGEIDLEV